MADIKPFYGIRPKQGLEARIAALPYDVYNREEAKKEAERENYSFLKIDRAETQFPDDFDMYSEAVYQKAHDILWKMIEQGDFLTEESPCYYIYELTMNGRSQTGIVACASIDDYQNGVIKKHENTRADKEWDRIHHVSVCKAQTGPIFLAYPTNLTINEMVAEKKKEKPIYDFTANDSVTHRVWVIGEPYFCSRIQEKFSQIQRIYIADGHHRCASAVKVGLQMREEKGSYTGDEEFNFFLSVLFPDEELLIMDYNRVLKDLNGHSKEEVLEKLAEHFQIEEIGNTPYKPEKKGTFGCLLQDTWYKLTANSDILSTDPVDGLDVSILQKFVLEPIFAIKDPKTDKRIDFVGGIRGLKELERRVQTDCKAAFSMYPTDIQELFAVSDANRLMPPKSTWFEPKLRSGLFIHSIKE